MASISPDLSVSSASRAASKRAGTSKYWRFGLPQSLRNVITSLSLATCVLSTRELPQNQESRRVEGTFATDAGDGRRRRSPPSPGRPTRRRRSVSKQPVSPSYVSLARAMAPFPPDAIAAAWLGRQLWAPAACHDKHLSRGVQEFGRELLVGGHRRPVAALALDGQLLQALREAALDRQLPACVRSYASTRRRRRVDGVEATSGDVDASLRVTPCNKRHETMEDAARRAIHEYQSRPSRPRRALPAPS